MKIEIKEKEYTIKYTLRALFIYEQMTGKMFSLLTMTDEYIFIYCLLIANAPDIEMSFEDFINECDINPELIISMQKFLAKEMEKQAAFIKDATSEDPKKELTISEIYSLLVIEGGINPEYVMDKMQMYELSNLLKNITKKNKESWEQTRMISYIIAQTNSTRKLKPTDILTFSWDNIDSNKETSISEKDVERLKREIKTIFKFTIIMDLVTRLLLNTSQFDNNIRSSTQLIQGFQSVGKSITSTIGKFAGVIGLSMGAMEAFNRTMNATQTTGDAFERVTTQGTAAVDTFFNALSRGDFSNFLSGLKNSISKAGELADVLDELQSKSLFNDIEINNLNTKKQIYQNKAKDKTLSDAERNKYNSLAQQTQGKIDVRKKDLAESNNNAYYTGIKALLAKGGYQGKIDNNMIDYIMAESNGDLRRNQAKKYNETLAKYQREKNKHTTITEGRNGTQNVKYDTEYYKILAQENEYKKKSFAKLNKVIEDTNEDEFKKYTQYKETANNQLLDISSSTTELHNTAAKINGSWKKLHKKDDPDAPTITIYNGDGSTSTVKKTKGVNNIVNQGSIDEVNKQLADTRKKYDAAATDELRAELFKVISDLEAKKIKLNFVAEYGEMKDVKPKMAGVLGDKTKGFEIPNKILSLTPIVSKDAINNNNEYAESLNAVGSMLSSITNMTQEGASAWLNWGATLLGAIASAIPAISALTVAKTAEANANSASAVTGAASSVASIPIVGWLLAASAAASVVAAMSNVPKFANGGLVYGNSLINVGEYAGASSNPEVIAPLSKLKKLIKPEDGNSIAGNVTFEIEGRKLVGVLSNYNKQQNRIK